MKNQKLTAVMCLLLNTSCGRMAGQKAGGCSVDEKPDRSVMVACEDGTSKVLRHGNNGKDGESCLMRPNPDVAGGGVQIRCPGGEWMIIRNGKDGTNGSNGRDGKDGTQCEVKEVLNGKALVCDGKVIMVTPS